jgi:hypothetical protein
MSGASKEFRRRRRAERERQKQLAAKTEQPTEPIPVEAVPPLPNDPCPNLFTDPHRITEDIKLISRFPIKPEWRDAIMAKMLRIFALSKKDRTTNAIARTFILMERLNMLQEDRILGRPATSTQAVQVNVNQTTVNATASLQPIDPAAAAREIILNDPDYIEYLRHKENAGPAQPGLVGGSVQSGEVADVPAPCPSGPLPDGNRSGPLEKVNGS